MKQANFSPYAEVNWLEEVNAIQVKWLQLHMSLEKFKEITDTVLKMISINKSSIWIADQYDSTGVFNKEIIEYISNELVGIAVANYKINLVLTVMPKEVGLSSLSTKQWMGDVQKMEAFTMASFANMEHCKQWILENK